MIKTIVKCNCDYCNADMSEWEYENSTKVTIRIDVPNAKGGAGDCNADEMKLCNECSKKLGIINEEIHNGFMGTRERIGQAIEKSKKIILSMFFERKDK